MKLPALATALTMLVTPALAADHVIKMLNEGRDGTRMAFEPSIVRATIGDTVTFVPEDGGHAAASVIVPTGAEAWEGALNAEAKINLTHPGVYLFKSKPHFAAGMIGMIVVDDAAANREAIDGFRPRGAFVRDRFELLRGQL